jgi:hypothetical protein
MRLPPEKLAQFDSEGDLFFFSHFGTEEARAWTDFWMRSLSSMAR